MQTPIPHHVFSFHDPQHQPCVTVLGPEGITLPIDNLLYFQAQLGRSINTLKALAYDLTQYFNWLEQQALQWDRVTLDVLPYYLQWLRIGDQQDLEHRVLPLKPRHLRKERTLQRKLASLYSFYDHHSNTPFARQFQDVLAQKSSRRKRRHPLPSRPIRVGQDVQDKPPAALTQQQVELIFQACITHRDRFLIALLVQRGLRIGQALGLRISDIDSRMRTYQIVPRNDNLNGERTKTRSITTLPLNRPLVVLYREYLYEEFGQINCDHVFVNLHGKARAQPMTYQGVRSMFQTLSRKTGVPFTPHTLRHTFATLAIGRGVPIAVVQAMLCHQDSSTTTGIYVHLKAETLRRWLDPTDDDMGTGPGSAVHGPMNPQQLGSLLDEGTP